MSNPVSSEPCCDCLPDLLKQKLQLLCNDLQWDFPLLLQAVLFQGPPELPPGPAAAPAAAAAVPSSCQSSCSGQQQPVLLVLFKIGHSVSINASGINVTKIKCSVFLFFFRFVSVASDTAKNANLSFSLCVLLRFSAAVFSCS